MRPNLPPTVGRRSARQYCRTLSSRKTRSGVLMRPPRHRSTVNHSSSAVISDGHIAGKQTHRLAQAVCVPAQKPVADIELLPHPNSLARAPCESFVLIAHSHAHVQAESLRSLLGFRSGVRGGCLSCARVGRVAPSSVPARATAPTLSIRRERQAFGSMHLSSVQDQGSADVGCNNVHAFRPVGQHAISPHTLDITSPAPAFLVVAESNSDSSEQSDIRRYPQSGNSPQPNQSRLSASAADDPVPVTSVRRLVRIPRKEIGYSDLMSITIGAQ